MDGELQRQEELRKAREAAAELKKQKETDSVKKPLSKKEKQAMKAKELDDLDQLLNEFGLVEHVEDSHTLDATPQNQTDGHETTEQSGTATTKKKKKKNKDVGSAAAEAPTDSNSTQTELNLNEVGTATANVEEYPSDNTPAVGIEDPFASTIDVASLLKAKASKKVKKTSADIAAATAAKEALAKKELAAKNQRKKSKDKYAFGGAPTR
jgi:hypothetical protein